jgi:A/G-specific adenine glycosylase
MNFSSTLISWYRQHKRDLPWRGITDPYPIWLSEIIMQQTRVEQGTAYYEAFLANFPTLKDLAKAPLDRILKLWQGLGYYSRARNLHEAAKSMMVSHKGQFPRTYEEILKLKGIGEYTASAISSFAYNEPHAVVDGNVYRVLSRVFGIDTPIDSTAGKKEFKALAQELLDKSNPGIFNQALMEFGATQCKPRNPDCPNCIFFLSCVARKKRTVDLLPVKANKTKVRDRYFNYLVVFNKDKTWLRKREAKDIWEGLYDFPLIESAKSKTENQLMASTVWKELFAKGKVVIKRESIVYKHILSHQRIFAKFWEIEFAGTIKGSGFKEVPVSKLQTFAVPRLVDRYLQEEFRPPDVQRKVPKGKIRQRI